jgi:predicted hydrocarbon binding protein
MVGLVEKVMETKVVTSIEFSRLEGKMFSNFHFPIFLFPNKRGIILPAEELNILEDDLKSKLGSEASSVIFEWGRRYGSNLVNQFPEDDVRKKEALEHAIEIMKATGWGIGKCETDEKGIVKFSLSDPTIDSETRIKDRFLAGMVQGIVEMMTGQNMKIIEDHFDAQKNSLNFTLVKSTRIQ